LRVLPVDIDRPGRLGSAAPPAGVTIRRRAALAGAFGLCASTGAGPLLAQIAPEATRLRPRPGDFLVRDSGGERRPLTKADVPLGQKQTIAWPLEPQTQTVRSGSRLNKVLVLRLDPATLDPGTKENSADGVLAYSAICPHTGCEVANWLAGPQILECPCHFSHYDPKAGAKVLSGPSPRRLAALPLDADGDGRLVVAKPFVGRVGIQQQD
jgi:rieske iron-sulfur protein